MAKTLRDYSGEFAPDLKLECFSRTTLIDLLKLYSRFYLAMDGFWYLSIKEKFGNAEALDRDLWVWKRGGKYEIERIVKLLKISGTDVLTFMKALQFLPWILQMAKEVDVKNKNHAILTITYCPILLALEKEGEGREEDICKIADRECFEQYAHFFDPNIEVTPLKLPPRQSKEEICCQWEFKLA